MVIIIVSFNNTINTINNVVQYNIIDNYIAVEKNKN